MLSNLQIEFEILCGKIRYLPPKYFSRSDLHFLTLQLCLTLREKHEAALAKKATDDGKEFDEWVALADNFFGFMLTNLPAELILLGGKTILTDMKLRVLPQKMKNWKPFAQQYTDVVLNNKLY